MPRNTPRTEAVDHEGDTPRKTPAIIASNAGLLLGTLSAGGNEYESAHTAGATVIDIVRAEGGRLLENGRIAPLVPCSGK